MGIAQKPAEGGPLSLLAASKMKTDESKNEKKFQTLGFLYAGQVVPIAIDISILRLSLITACK